MRNGSVFLVPYSKTIKGLLVGTEPVYATSLDDPELVKLIDEALAHSLEGIPHPTSWKGVVKPLLKAAKARSYENFADDTRYVGINKDDGHVEFVPSKNGGRGNRFLHLPQKAVQVEATAAKYPLALREAFSRCE